MKKNPKICFVSGIIPWPLSYGMRHRQYHILKALSALGQVDMVIFTRNKIDEIPSEIDSLCRNVWLQQVNVTSTFRFPIAYLVEILNSIYYWPIKKCFIHSKFLRPKFANFVGNIYYDVIWVERLNNIAHSQHINGKLKIMDFDDIQHFIIERTLKLKHRYDVKKYYLSLRAHRTHMIEKRALRTFDKVLVCSEKDNRYLDTANVEVIENCIGVSSDAKYTAGRTGYMLFIGNLGYYPNDEAVRYFIKSILPRIHDHLPKATLTIIGAGPSRMLVDTVKQTKGVHLAGFAPNIEPYYTNAQLSVVPLRIGGGTRIKILESLAKKVPVVSTSIGAEGLNLVDHEHILIADEPREFADACIKLLKNQDIREKIALSAFRRILSLYSPRKLQTRVRAIVNKAMDTTTINPP